MNALKTKAIVAWLPGYALLEKGKDSLHTRCRVLFPTALLVVACLLPTEAAAATDTSWQLPPPTVGDWSESSNWSDGVPGIYTNAFIDNGGSVVVSQDASVDDLVMGTAVGLSGNVTHNSGEMLISGNTFVGSFGNGTYNIAGGSVHAYDVSVAAYPGSTGSMTISDGYFRPGYFFVGMGRGSLSGGTGSVLQTGGTVEVYYAGFLVEGGPQATYELGGGTLLALDQTIGGSGNARFIQSGGINDAHSPSGGGYGSGMLRLGDHRDGEALYELRAGDLLTNSSSIGGSGGLGRLTQTGGQHHVFGDAGIGRGSDSEGTYELHEGNLTVDQRLSVGTSGTGELAVLGSDATLQLGELVVGDAGTASFAISASGVSVANVSGDASFSGTLQVFDDGAAPGEFPLLDVDGNLDFNPLAVELPGPQWSWHLTEDVVWVSYVPEPTPFSLDIKPGSDENPLNLTGKGVLPVSILTTDEFDALTVDIETLLFGDPLLIDDGSTPVPPIRIEEGDVNRDGLMDLTLFFSVAEMVENGVLGPLSEEASLTGSLFDGTGILGSDILRIVPKSKGNVLGPIDEAEALALGGSADISPIPEPSTLALLFMGVFGFMAYVRRRR